MPRTPRNEEPGATYHVIGRGVDRRRIFVDELDYERYTRRLGEITNDYGWRLLCYCLMPNHVHLMLETPTANLGKGMHWLHGSYAVEFNRRHVRHGHLFDERFKSPRVNTDEKFVRLVGYVVANPVAARLCARAHEWPWGSHAAVAGGSAPPWLDHGRLSERLDDMTQQPNSYANVVETWERDRY